jgi:hypothetical protein
MHTFQLAMYDREMDINNTTRFPITVLQVLLNT